MNRSLVFLTLTIITFSYGSVIQKGPTPLALVAPQSEDRGSIREQFLQWKTNFEKDRDAALQQNKLSCMMKAEIDTLTTQLVEGAGHQGVCSKPISEWVQWTSSWKQKTQQPTDQIKSVAQLNDKGRLLCKKKK